MIRAIKIELYRAEGFADECGPAPAIEGERVWQRANETLMRWSHTAPKNGGYDKCDFKITFADGETYEGRFDLMHWSCEFPNLAGHVQSFCEFASLRRKPSRYTVEEWTNYGRQEHVSEAASGFAKMLDDYEIGDEPVKVAS